MPDIKRKLKVFLALSLIMTIYGCGDIGNNPAKPGLTTTASGTITWVPPTTNTDGSSLTDLAGYTVFYGTSSGNYTNSTDVGNTTSYAFINPTPGTAYYFAVKVYDAYGNTSAFSNEVSLT